MSCFRHRDATLGRAILVALVAAGTLCACSPSATAPPSPAGGSTQPSASSPAADVPTPLVGIGGSIRAFDAAHPSGAGGYGAPLSIDGAVVLAFTRSLVPSISAAAAKELLLSDLPSDTKVIADISQATCEQIWVTSSSIQSAMQARGSLVVVTLTTPGISTYDPRRVGLLTFDSDLVHRPGERGC